MVTTDKPLDETAAAVTSEAGPTAIVVDDSATSRNYLKLMLARAGIKVLGEAATGDQALPLYERCRPTLMTLDIVLPGLDGVAAARQILERFPDAKVVMCSSISAREKILECRDIGVAHFILKPFTPEKISEVVGGVLAKVRAAQQPAGGTP